MGHMKRDFLPLNQWIAGVPSGHQTWLKNPLCPADFSNVFPYFPMIFPCFHRISQPNSKALTLLGAHLQAAHCGASVLPRGPRRRLWPGEFHGMSVDIWLIYGEHTINIVSYTINNG